MMEFQHKENARLLFSSENLGQYWNDFYAEAKTCLEYHFVRRLEVSDRVVRENSDREATILDLGCGAGVLSERLLAAGYRVDAGDLSQDMLELTRERLSRFDPATYRVLQTDCEKLDLDDARYDLVACIGVFGYIDEVDAALDEINRVMKPGGKFVMSIRNADNLNLFDLSRLLRNIFVRAPLKILRALLPASRRPGPATAGGRASQASPRSFINIWDRPRDVIRIVGRRGFRLTDFHGLGYGPLQFAGKPLVPDSWAIAMSNGITRLTQLTGLERYSKWVADVSIYVFEKE